MIAGDIKGHFAVADTVQQPAGGHLGSSGTQRGRGAAVVNADAR
jgi:hypothetical protein